SAPRTAEDLRTVILERYDTFSGRLQQVARHVLDHPDDLALETLTVIADRAHVQPSAIVRFAKSLGFSGASPMQKLLRDGLVGKRVFFLDGVGGLARQQVRTIEANDLLIGISYHPYAAETVEVMEAVSTAGAKVLAISDSLVGPVAKASTLVLQVRDSDVRNF